MKMLSHPIDKATQNLQETIIKDLKTIGATVVRVSVPYESEGETDIHILYRFSDDGDKLKVFITNNNPEPQYDEVGSMVEWELYFAQVKKLGRNRRSNHMIMTDRRGIICRTPEDLKTIGAVKGLHYK